MFVFLNDCGILFAYMKVHISTRLIQKPILAPSMQQSIEVLLLPVVDLEMAIEQELQNNPLLELDEEKPDIEKDAIEKILGQRIHSWEDRFPANHYSDHREEEDMEERPITRKPPLEDYLLQQFRLELIDPLELRIGELIIGNLDEDGYFRCSVEEIAQLVGLHETGPVCKVLETIQGLEPIGIASRNLRECLLIQVHYKFNGESELLKVIINNFLDELGRKKYMKIARELKIPEEKVREVCRCISQLEPRPARNYRPIHPHIYIKPDVTITQNGESGYHIHINKECISSLRINPVYKRMLLSPTRTPEEKTFIQEKIKNAVIFLKSIEQRHQTLREITEYILRHQKDFFEQDHTALKPMILRDVAQAVGRNESTISRAINGKYMDTPQGLFPMKFFFAQAVSPQSENSISSRGIKEEIKTLIEAENKVDPLSDQEIRLYLERKQMKISRRTVAKYRQVLHILPSNLRKV